MKCDICGETIFLDEEVAEIGNRTYHADCYDGD